MDIEFNVLETRDTFKKVHQPNDTTLIPTKWVWSYKFDEQGHLLKFKARLQPMNNEEVYASTLALKTFRILLAVICNFDWLDAANPFVHARIDQLVHSLQE